MKSQTNFVLISRKINFEFLCHLPVKIYIFLIGTFFLKIILFFIQSWVLFSPFQYEIDKAAFKIRSETSVRISDKSRLLAIAQQPLQHRWLIYLEEVPFSSLFLSLSPALAAHNRILHGFSCAPKHQICSFEQVICLMFIFECSKFILNIFICFE